MDGHFVPNLTIGLPVVEGACWRSPTMDAASSRPSPGRWAPPYAEAGAYNVTFHAGRDNPGRGPAVSNRRGQSRDQREARDAGAPQHPPAPFDTLLVSVEPGFGVASGSFRVASKVRAVPAMVDAGG